MEPSENVVGGITPQFESEIQNLARHTSPEENTLVVAVLEALSRGAIDPRQVDRVPEHWRGLLYHIQGKAPNECSGMAQRAVHIVEEVIASMRPEPEAMPEEEEIERKRLRSRAESAEVLPESGLPENILGVMSARARASFAQTSTMGHRVVQDWRVQKMKELQQELRENTELCGLLPYFCSTKLDSQHPETCDRMLSELEDFVPDLIKSVEQSPLLTAKEKAALCNHFYPEILQNPTLLKNLLAAAYNLSLINLTPDSIKEGVPNWEGLTFGQKVTALKEELQRHSQERFEIDIDIAEAAVCCIPKEICAMQGLRNFSCKNQSIRVIPPELGQLTQLRTLDLSANRLSSLPPELGQLRWLNFLELANNRLSSLPPELWQLTHLVNLHLSANRLSSLPPELGRLVRLRHLVLANNTLSSLPPELGQLTQLETLDLSANSLSSLPPELGRLRRLIFLRLANNTLSSFPHELGQLTQLNELNLSANRLSSLPPELWQLTQLGRLDLSANRLSSLPPELWQLTQLNELNLSANSLSSLPSGLGQLTQLISLNLSNNSLFSLPPELGRLTQLKWLALSSNGLSSLPPELGQLTQLIILWLSGNPLSLPQPVIEQLKQGGTEVQI